MSNSTASPILLTDPGFLFWAPIGSTEPTNTVTGGVFTDTWPVAWVNLGATEDGSEFKSSLKIEAVEVAEFLEAVAYRTTGREASIAFKLASFTQANLKKVLNGGTTVVTGSTGTTLTTFEPPDPGSEVRAMIGWESLDATVRLVCRQTINSGDVALTFKKAPAKALLPAEFKLEKPASAKPFQMSFAGPTRV